MIYCSFARLCHLKAMYEGYEAAEAFYKKDVHLGSFYPELVWFSGNLFCWIPRNILTLNLQVQNIEPDKKRSDYNKAYNPSGTLYVIDELYEIDKELKEVLDYYKRNPDVSLKLGLSFLRWH